MFRFDMSKEGGVALVIFSTGAVVKVDFSVLILGDNVSLMHKNYK
jgi:hypothetical protein